jgi:hypothetical protein
MELLWNSYGATRKQFPINTLAGPKQQALGSHVPILKGLDNSGHLRNPGRRSFLAITLSSLWDFGLAHSARIFGQHPR